MDFINYHINFTNFEDEDVEIQIQDLDTLDDPPGATVDIDLQGSEDVAILDTVDSDDDKTRSIKGRRLTFGFNSDDDQDVGTFSDGDDGRFFIELRLGVTPDTIPFIGTMVIDDNQEAFQPKPNSVRLRAGEGLGSLKTIELKDGDDLPVGHYSIMEYLVMIFDKLIPNQRIHVIFNLWEEDTNTTSSHAFLDTFLDALTFEKEVDEREDCFTVLEKICDAFGCFVTYDNDGWWIIRWDEYDAEGASIVTHRTANFTNVGTLTNYTLEDLSKRIVNDGDPDYEGFYLSQDSAVRRFQRRVNSVEHEYLFEQPKEVPCNSGFTRGTVDDDVLPLKTYDPECWTIHRGWGTNEVTPNSEMKIWVRYDANDDEDERYLTLTPQASSGGEFNYALSEAIPIIAKDKFEYSFEYSADSDNATDGPASIGISAVVLYGDDNSVWILGDNISAMGDEQVPEWKLTDAELSVNFDYYQWFFDADSGDEDYTEFRNYSITAPPAPVSGRVYIHLFAANQLGSVIDDFVIRYNGLRFTYIPYINALYSKLNGQRLTVTGDNNSRKTISKQMYISDSPRPLFKGALKKYDGSNYVLTGLWSDFIKPTTLPDSRLAKHILFQWWNQFRKTRTVIETDVQGLAGHLTPGLIHRYRIQHGDETNKLFMLTSIRQMNFATCGWQGVFVETSDMDGDRNYDDAYEFKYIQS